GRRRARKGRASAEAWREADDRDRDGRRSSRAHPAPPRYLARSPRRAPLRPARGARAGRAARRRARRTLPTGRSTRHPRHPPAPGRVPTWQTRTPAGSMAGKGGKAPGKTGARFGTETVYMPRLQNGPAMKFGALLWALFNGRAPEALPELPTGPRAWIRTAPDW